MQLLGLHHVTAVTGNASRNVAFYTKVLGMRLTKKTVNQDDVSAYHLFYGDELGRPGTDLTFFEWPHIGPYRHGNGTISTISFGVTGHDALEWWAKRLDTFHTKHDGIRTRGEHGPAYLTFRDPEGQRLELVDDQGKLESTPWRKSPIPVELAIRGFYAVQLTVKHREPTEAMLTRVLGFRQVDGYQTEQNQPILVYEVGSGGPGTQVHLDVQPELSYGRVGIGGVHHVAFRSPTYEEHQQWQTYLSSTIRQVTPVIDRFYFRSIYFREPGGVLFELATDGPGFATDEDASALGERLSLPPFLEPRRAEIEANLTPISAVSASSL